MYNRLLERLSAVYKVIDDNWFHQEARPEEEVYATSSGSSNSNRRG